MQTAPMYLGSASFAGPVRPSLHHREEFDFCVHTSVLAEPMKIELPALPPQPAASRATRAPPGLEGLLPPPGAFAPLLPPGISAPPAAPPGAFSKAAYDQEGSDCCSTSAGQDGESSEASAEVEDTTTMAILNIPYTYPKWKLQRQMENEGYTFNYFHFPRDSRRGRNRGFAFVNFTTAEMAQAFRLKFDNMPLFHPGEEQKPVTVVPSSLQGFEGNRALHPGAAARNFKPAMQRR